MSDRGARIVQVLAGLSLSCYLVGVAIVLLNADPGLATEVIAGTEQQLIDFGAPDWMTWGARVQLMLNALMFMPLAFLASVMAPIHPWGNWVAYSFAASGLVEIVQAFALEPRSAEYVDVVANTLGAFVGALIAVPLCRALTRHNKLTV